MEFLEIVLTVCSLANANICEDQRIIVDSRVARNTCNKPSRPWRNGWSRTRVAPLTRSHCDYSGTQQRKT